MASFYLTQDIRAYRRKKGNLFSYGSNVIWYDPVEDGDVLRLFSDGHDEDMPLPFDRLDDHLGNALLLPQPNIDRPGLNLLSGSRREVARIPRRYFTM